MITAMSEEFRTNFYIGLTLDRAAHLREDRARLSGWLEGGAHMVPVWRTQSLISGLEAPKPRILDSRDLHWGDAEPFFLGLIGDEPVFTVDLSHHDEPPLEGEGEFHDLRAVGPLLDRDSGALLAYARGILHWHSTHLFCGRCGSPTESRQAGHSRGCINPDCGRLHFPRTDPAVIMAVHDGQGNLLMGRQAIWPPGMHSTLAGFVEPGESLEQAVAREVFEEAGIRVTDVRYQSSQPWPFPSSIMLGFTARALDTEVRIDTEELESARWFSREELLNCPEDESFRLPRRDSIARKLVEDWLAEG